MATRLRWTEAYQFTDPSRDVAQPVLVITGEDRLDRVVAPQLTRRYLAALPDARDTSCCRGPGTSGLLTKPDEFAELVRRFADEIVDTMPDANFCVRFPARPGRSRRCSTAGRTSRAPRRVFAHPHPLHGGTMHTKAVYQAAKALARIGVAVLRFNFRGVGAQRRHARRRARRDGRLSRRARLHGGAVSRAAALGRGLLVRIVGRADRRRSTIRASRCCSASACRSTATISRRSSTSAKPKFLIHGELDELIPLREVRQFYARAARAEGARRHRRRRSSVRRQDRRSRRGRRRPARRAGRRTKVQS